MQALAITGPRSVRRHVNAFVNTSPDSIRVVETPSLDQVLTHVQQAPPDLIVLFGGDGTLNRYLSVLHRSQIPLLAFPTGSGNDFAMACGIFSAQDALRAWFDFQRGRRTPKAADLGCAKLDGVERLFSCCLNVGLDADAAERANQLPDWLKQRKGYLLAGALAILRYQPRMLTVTGASLDGISERGWFVAVSNTPTYGGGLKIAPQASINDGRLDITYLQPIPRLELIGHFPKILAGTHVHLPCMSIFEATALRIQTEVPLPVYADGEFFGQTPLEIAVVPNAIRTLELQPE